MSRPTTTRKVTRKTEERRDAALDQGVSLSIDGEAYVVRVGDVTPQIARELRAESGMSFMRLINTVTVDPDIDVVSAFVWVARRIRGENVAFGDVAVTYGQILSDGFEVSTPDAEAADSPEA